MRLACPLACCLPWLLSGAAIAAGIAPPQDCAPRIVAVQAARAAASAPALRPAQGYADVHLPDHWARRWPWHDGSVWYRIDWERRCAGDVALGIDGITMAGEVFSNDDLLWRDASLTEPLSRSWNVPRWWLLPASGLRAGVNSVWVRVVGLPDLSAGLGVLRLGDARTVSAEYDRSLWRQRTVYFINAVLCVLAAALFLPVWALRRWGGVGAAVQAQASAYGWFGLMALSWLAYLTTYLAQTPWPWSDSMTRGRFSLAALVCYALCVCLFTFRFGEQHLPRVERALWALAAVGVAGAALAPRPGEAPWFDIVWQGAMAVVLVNGAQFQWHAWRPRSGGRRMAHMLLALCWLVFVAVGLNNLFSVLDRWQVARDWAALSGLSVIALVMLLLGAQLVRQRLDMERFNRELAQGVADARADLAQALAREHAQALENTRLQERVQIAHDLHDGLGGSLMRSMALVERAQQALPNQSMLSLLKNLRDELRHVIDYGFSATATVPETPVQWVAPLRHRFTRILDELGVASQWRIDPRWPQPHSPGVLQCLGLTRLLEEALSNVIRHSRARNLCVSAQFDRSRTPPVLLVRVSDDGIGFDVAAAQGAGLSVGLRSMAARAERIGARFAIVSESGATLVQVDMPLHG